MERYCGKCGSRLDSKTGLCLQCDKVKIAQIYLRKKKFRHVILVALTVLLIALVAGLGVKGLRQVKLGDDEQLSETQKMPEGTIICTDGTETQNENNVEEESSPFPLEIADYQQTILGAGKYLVALRNDGRVMSVGYSDRDPLSFSDWLSVTELVPGESFVLGLRENGTVLGEGEFIKECEIDVSNWKDIVELAAGRLHAVGLKADGTVVASGINEWGSCDVSEWTDIVAIDAGIHHTLGLKSDGTVVAAGGDSAECQVSGWRNIVSISAGNYYSLGLRADGTVAAAGNTFEGPLDVEDWTDIAALFTSFDYAVGLKADGSVVATKECPFISEISEWKDIVYVLPETNYIVGLKSDGTVVSADGKHADIDVSGWTDIVLIASGGSDYVFGLKSDGTVVTAGNFMHSIEGIRSVLLPEKTSPYTMNITDTVEVEKFAEDGGIVNEVSMDEFDDALYANAIHQIEEKSFQYEFFGWAANLVNYGMLYDWNEDGIPELLAVYAMEGEYGAPTATFDLYTMNSDGLVTLAEEKMLSNVELPGEYSSISFAKIDGQKYLLTRAESGSTGGGPGSWTSSRCNQYAMNGDTLDCVNELKCTEKEVYNDSGEKISSEYSGELNGEELSSEDAQYWYNQLVNGEGIERYGELIPFEELLSQLGE